MEDRRYPEICYRDGRPALDTHQAEIDHEIAVVIPRIAKLLSMEGRQVKESLAGFRKRGLVKPPPLDPMSEIAAIRLIADRWGREIKTPIGERVVGNIVQYYH